MAVLLALAHRTGVAPQVLRYLDATPVALGNSFGALEAGGSANATSCRNRVVQIGGAVYAVQDDGVYKLQSDNVTWLNSLVGGGLVFSNPSVGVDAEVRSGVHVVYVGGAPRLLGAYRTTTGQLRAFWFDPSAGGWSEGAVSSGLVNVPVGSLGGFWNEIVFEGELHLFGSDSISGLPRAFRYSPNDDSWTSDSITIADVADRSLDFCVFNNRLHCTYRTSAAEVRLGEWVAGSWGFVALIDAGPVTSAVDAHRHLLITDQSFLYAFIGSDNTWRCWKIDGAFTPTDVSTLVLPTALRSGALGGTFVGAPNGRMISTVDLETIPGTIRYAVFYASSGAPGTVWNLFRWNGNAALMTLIGFGGDVAHAMSSSHVAGGERSFGPGEFDVLIVSKAPVLGGERIYFKCFGAPGPTDKIVAFVFNREGEPATAVATLSGVAAGGTALRNGNQVEQVEADGATTFETTWDVLADGLTPGDFATLVPRISS